MVSWVTVRRFKSICSCFPARTWHKASGLALLAALLLPPPGIAFDANAAGEQADARFPSIPLVNLDSTSTNSDQWRGKPSVINIWATWCPPCRTEMPSLQKLSELLQPEGIRVVALSIDNDQNLVREFVLKYGISMPVAIANSPNQAMGALKAFALPLTIYVGADGYVIDQYLGPRDWASDDVVRELKLKLLPRKTAKP